ncbi:MAG: TetR/AcrR family transcriptional regulator C-terminal domain-containing protein [Pseudomonadota bacterium]
MATFIQLDRTMHEVARRNPDLAKRFYENAYGREHDDITAVLQHGLDEGFVVHSASARDLADHLISIWEGLRFVRTRLGVDEMQFEDPEARSTHCVKTLFRR